LDVRFVPIERWPGEVRKPKDGTSPFSVGFVRLLEELEDELRHLHARDILIQAYFTHDQIRLDGWPKSTEKPSRPGVILSFAIKKGDLSFPCDTYAFWQDNLRAISLALKALRAVERYGVTRRQEQYTGWAKLPPAPTKLSPLDAMAFMAIHSGFNTIDQTNFSDAYREAAKRLHPDKQSGNEHQFRLLGQARDVLKESYRW
jgi:hypothetical protein